MQRKTDLGDMFITDNNSVSGNDYSVHQCEDKPASTEIPTK